MGTGLVTEVESMRNAAMLGQVRGLGYDGDGKRLMVASDEGLAVYERGKWFKTPGRRLAYTGFASTHRHLYASGYPATGSGVPIPLGLIRSRDGGRSWDKLGLEGETSFLFLAAGWTTGALYVWNPQPNSRMDKFGVHYTLDEGQSWHAATAVGLGGDVQTLAAHAYAAGTVAIGTQKGTFLSRDFGDSFKSLARDVQAFALHFDLDGERLWLGSFAGTAYLSRIELRSGTIEPAPTPRWGRNAASSIVQNPASRLEYAIATPAHSVYLSKNGARTWTQIVDRARLR